MAQAIHVVVDVHSSASVKARDDQPMALNNIDINSQWSVSMQDLLFTITSPPLMLDVNPYKTKNVSMAVSDVETRVELTSRSLVTPNSLEKHKGKEMLQAYGVCYHN